MGKHKIAHLVKMLNQIASSVPAANDQEAVAKTKEHLQKFWTKDMQQDVIDYKNRGNHELNDIADKAITQIEQ